MPILQPKPNAHLGQLARASTGNLLDPKRCQLGLQLVELSEEVGLVPATRKLRSALPLICHMYRTRDALGLKLESPDFGGGGRHGYCVFVSRSSSWIDVVWMKRTRLVLSDLEGNLQFSKARLGRPRATQSERRRQKSSGVAAPTISAIRDSRRSRIVTFHLVPLSSVCSRRTADIFATVVRSPSPRVVEPSTCLAFPAAPLTLPQPHPHPFASMSTDSNVIQLTFKTVQNKVCACGNISLSWKDLK
jgi:hypothetical protein